MAELPWLKLWNETRYDKKLESLTDKQFRIWIYLLCYANQQAERGLITESSDIMAMELTGGNEAFLADALSRFEKLRMIQTDDRGILITNFAKRNHRKPSEMPESRRERQSRKRAADKSAEMPEKQKESPCPKEEVLALWQKLCPHLAQPQKWTSNRQVLLSARWRENPEMSFWEELFGKIGSSKFLAGENDRAWKADLLWVLKSENFAKCIEGNYSRPPGGKFWNRSSAPEEFEGGFKEL